MRGNKIRQKRLYITAGLLDSDFNPSSHPIINATSTCKVEYTTLTSHCRR